MQRQRRQTGIPFRFEEMHDIGTLPQRRLQQRQRLPHRTQRSWHGSMDHRHTLIFDARCSIIGVMHRRRNDDHPMSTPHKRLRQRQHTRRQRPLWADAEWSKHHNTHTPTNHSRRRNPGQPLHRSPGIIAAGTACRNNPAARHTVATDAHVPGRCGANLHRMMLRHTKKPRERC